MVYDSNLVSTLTLPRREKLDPSSIFHGGLENDKVEANNLALMTAQLAFRVWLVVYCGWGCGLLSN